MAEHMLTTVDNPFSPITHYTEWDVWDQASGYHTAALLARIVITSDELSEADQAAAGEAAIEEICRINASGMHRKVAIPGT